MNKRIRKNQKKLCLILSFVILFALVGCKSDSSIKKSSKSDKTITLFSNKSEVESQLKELATLYKSKTGITVKIESVPAGVNAQSVLKGYYLSDKMPDIIVCESSGFKIWNGLLQDMSNCSWTKKTDSAYLDENGKILGFPYTKEAVGITYNANILDRAGIDPKSLTSPKAYEAAFSKLDSMKSQLGITAVVGYCVEPKELYWSTGNHIFGQYLDAGLNRDDTKYIDLLSNGGKIDKERFTKFTSFIELLGKYSDKNLLLQGTYDQQVSNFAEGKYAFVTQGSWIGSSINSTYKNKYDTAGSFKIGIAPFAFEDGIDTILTNAPAYWAVLKEGNSKEAIKFLEWCSKDSAQQILVEKAGFTSPFNDCKYVADDPFAKTISEYDSNKKESGWHSMEMKENAGRYAIAPYFYKLAAGELNSTTFIEQITQSIENYYIN
ncbi:ABC transporter substrate-binding protein [Lachnobacterium bovis]|jgi:raffinose/stachyose/melibiose transport system substrate-binding protein|uniref:Raffinose/stachyose/melibiose transport system substrate-binding protein n=1 Tax=Lachnobacterium bovis DSM 14045 TaxID=1122142 RepID=A0A1H3F6M4_9FIRM|nr:ABC transporter substrate-binding protein [Lachnobacterium bovis]SDX85998.1 raffinose/stachyose/melibiose transport system substrate-binding protein [Lachnobacterium bovis DSM 14045]